MPAENTPVRIDIPEGQPDNTSKAHLKHDHSVGSRDNNFRKKKH